VVPEGMINSPGLWNVRKIPRQREEPDVTAYETDIFSIFYINFDRDETALASRVLDLHHGVRSVRDP
jgi:hypothetical protein